MRSGDFGRLCEAVAARDLGMELMPGSGGSMAHKREDMQGHGLLVQQKSTNVGSVSVKLADLEHLVHHALMRRLKPAFLIRYCMLNGHPVRGGSWIAVPEAYFRELAGF